jgi:curved DNA-binding protein CbpA
VSLYDELGVPPGADADTLHRAYRSRARQLHPDASGAMPGGEEAMRRLNVAWSVLRDPARRAAYDAGLGFDGVGFDGLGFDGGPAQADAGDDGAEPLVVHGRLVRRAPWIVVLAILLAIFIITAYAAVPTPSGSTGSTEVTVSRR